MKDDLKKPDEPETDKPEDAKETNAKEKPIADVEFRGVVPTRVVVRPERRDV